MKKITKMIENVILDICMYVCMNVLDIDIELCEEVVERDKNARQTPSYAYGTDTRNTKQQAIVYPVGEACALRDLNREGGLDGLYIWRRRSAGLM